MVVGEAVAGLARSREEVAPAQGCVALPAQASMDSWVHAALAVGGATAGRARRFCRDVLALALCRERRILGGRGWRRAEPKSVQGISTSFWPDAACKRQLRRERWDKRRCVRNDGIASNAPFGRQWRWPAAGNHDNCEPLMLACMTTCEGESLRGRYKRCVACTA